MSPQTGASPGVENAVKCAWLIIICSGRRRDIIALFASDLKTNTNVIHQAERTEHSTMR
jgi:hypothetical protein